MNAFNTLFLLFLYFIPVLVGIRREHRNLSSIFWCNALLGWTVLGWVVALIWAWSDNTAQEVPQ